MALYQNSAIYFQYTDICARSHSRCALEGDIFWDDDFLAAVDNHNVSYPVFVSSTTGEQDYSSVVGKYDTYTVMAIAYTPLFEINI
jgi:hypothetical protein